MATPFLLVLLVLLRDIAGEVTTQFHKRGFVILRGALSLKRVEEMQSRVQEHLVQHGLRHQLELPPGSVEESIPGWYIGGFAQREMLAPIFQTIVSNAMLRKALSVSFELPLSLVHCTFSV